MITATNLGKLTFAEMAPEAGLKRAREMGPEAVIEVVTASNLRGRGGAGFPTGLKWKLARAIVSDDKYVVCNADEGEPGTFKDRVILSDYADLLFEGMSIAALAIGGNKGLLYLRAEYTYLVPHLEAKLAARRAAGLLDEKFDIEIRMGSGAYVCGEETALIESMEGGRGEPRNRPPFPVEVGFKDSPTVVNNVETFCWAACIVAKGADWFKSAGTERSAGYKLFSVSGDCEKPGVYEFPWGITVADLLRAVGGEDAKAVQIGGASGTCVPASQFGRKIAYEDIGTGGSVIVFGQDRDMLEVAENFLEFFVEESCGQCTPCREGNVKLLEGIRMLRDGECSMRYLNELISLGETMQIASKCGLGQTSPSAFLNIVTHFKGEIFGGSL